MALQGVFRHPDYASRTPRLIRIGNHGAMPLAEVGRLQVAEDFAFQRRNWRVQRVAWIVMALILAAALAGVFGSGPLNHARKSAPGGLFGVDYERFAHREGQMRLRVRYAAQAVHEDSVRIALDARYLEKIQVQHVEPQPQKVEIGADRYTYVFASKHSPGAVTFELRFQDAGTAHAGLAIGGARVSFSQFVYP